MLSVIPMLRVLFDNSNRLDTPPVWNGIRNIKDYGEGYLNYFITQKQATEGADGVLFFMVVLVITMFLLKNLFGYYLFRLIFVKISPQFAFDIHSIMLDAY